ncbi:hypothetical protein J4711_13640, partial [Staphylococcus epidermidis]|nr:hypothetical protein [Staphylococcus epidermidis]
MTDELDIGLFFKRARTLQLLLGDARFQGTLRSTERVLTMTKETHSAASIGDKIKAITAQLTSPGAPFELQTMKPLRWKSCQASQRSQTLPQLINAGRAMRAAEFMVYGEDRWSFDRFFSAVDAV